MVSTVTSLDPKRTGSGHETDLADLGAGATMRWKPQVEDEANKGLHILKDLMLPVKQNHPEISLSDLWAFAGI